MQYLITFLPPCDLPMEAEFPMGLADSVSSVVDMVKQRHREYPGDCAAMDYRNWYTIGDTDMAYMGEDGATWVISHYE